MIFAADVMPPEQGCVADVPRGCLAFILEEVGEDDPRSLTRQ